jgi:hypothetical protein
MRAALTIGIAVLVAVATGCAPVATATGAGRLAVGARFPVTGAGLALKNIPEKTASIVIRVTGDRIPEGAVLATTLTPEKAQAVFEAVPAGWKTIHAKCFDASEAMLAAGETNVLIEAMHTAAAKIVLEPVSEDGGFELVLQ